MISAQNIKNKTFEKAIFGGYDIRGVEDYIEEISAEFSVLQKENMALKAKLKDINDKNEEYRAVENSMRKALLSAQEIAGDMVSKAETERDNILKEAKEIAEEQINTYRKQINEEQEKLRVAKENTVAFVTKMTAFYEQQSSQVIALSQELPVGMAVNPTDDFTLNLSKENQEEISSIKSGNEFSITENILEKIKQETISPKVAVGKMEVMEIPVPKPPTPAKPEEPKKVEEKKHRTDSKFQISELKFGRGYKDK